MRSGDGGWGSTAVAVLLLGVMLFPVYWMINVSFTRDTDMRASPPRLFPVDGTLDGWRMHRIQWSGAWTPQSQLVLGREQVGDAHPVGRDPADDP